MPIAGRSPSLRRLARLFRIARDADASGLSSQEAVELTRERERAAVSCIVFGTPAYMSPEQCESTGNIDHRSDIYSLGCILFQLVTGHAPFDGTMREMLTAHRTTLAPRLRTVVPDVCPELDALVAAMLAKDPAERPQTMAEVERALGGNPVAAPAPTPAAAPSSTSRRLGVALLAVATVLGFCLSCGAV